MNFDELLTALLATMIEDRDGNWEAAFLEALPRADAKVLNPDPQEGPDHWPYILAEVNAPGATGADESEPITNLLAWLSTKGIGLVVNPQKPTPDFVLTYGMIWNYRERGQFLTPTMTATTATAKSGLFEIKDGQQLWVGIPSEAYLPRYVRGVIKQFFADQGIFAPKVLMVSTDNQNFDLCLSIESLKSPPAQEHANIAEALSWFLPSHYSVGLLSEKTANGFTVL